jgi:predicted DNA-binding transcriptional regulator YafY
VRADRLVAIVLLLQTRGQLTAAQLAELLETSERTVRRDLEALCMAGVPLYSQRGRGGGWALWRGHRLDLTGFTAGEAEALFLVAGASGSRGSATPALASALRKVLAALPEPLRQHATVATGATVVDESSWGRPVAEDPVHLDALRAAVLRRRQVDLAYQRPGQAPSWRRVEPYGLVAKRGVWYLLAGTARGRRTYRVSRVSAVDVAEEEVTLPEGFDLGAEWVAAEREFLDGMQKVDLEVEVADAAVFAFTASLRGWASVEEAPGAPAGWRRFRASVPALRAAAVHLAGFGAQVSVRWPEELREELAELGRQLVAVHGPPATAPPEAQAMAKR